MHGLQCVGSAFYETPPPHRGSWILSSSCVHDLKRELGGGGESALLWKRLISPFFNPSYSAFICMEMPPLIMHWCSLNCEPCLLHSCRHWFSRAGSLWIPRENPPDSCSGVADMQSALLNLCGENGKDSWWHFFAGQEGRWWDVGCREVSLILPPLQTLHEESFGVTVQLLVYQARLPWILC